MLIYQHRIKSDYLDREIFSFILTGKITTGEI